VELAKAAVWRGRHPGGWGSASGVVILKPGKDDYRKLKACRSISQLSCMGKVVAKVVAELLAEETERRALLSDSQFWTRKRRSQIDARAIPVQRAPASLREGSIAGAHLMYIKTALPSVGRRILVRKMKSQGIDRDLIWWRASFLSDRANEVVLQGNVMAHCPVEAGIPQGSPVSLILYST